ncbi:dehydrogenase/reductase SDR family member 12-like isoform X2 [Anneissia japonica]|uniref:dehydrogenase/reductase SDR family member 12-like isoform X2 n=1 Tax=Anneissia japonica TaxID=1529436 RepID=UPI001425907E|nr:dehydrogenase/reductase SDR family member 12-like isoform X2 [Anneissia japonica]XP_033100984.1 dehydrogenase/reductase SDR family member 12-like isoform X2 [Anneissia japonica]
MGSFYRNAVFITKGIKEFTKGGYNKSEKSFDLKALDVDLSEKVFMVTGANSGIGKSAAETLAQKGGTVHMVCRNLERGEEAKNNIIQKTGNQDIHLHILDMSKPNNVFEFAKSFQENQPLLDVLVNNAGCMINTREKQEDGLEKNFATNTLGTYILTTELIPLLSKSSQGRVITVSSGGMYTTKLNIEDFNSDKMSKFDGTFVYAQNKRQQVVMTSQWAKQHSNVLFSAMHPGWADTPAVRTSMPGFYNTFKEKLRSPEQGADTIVWLAIADEPTKLDNGQFFLDRKVARTHLPLAWTKSTPEEDEKLMARLQELFESIKSQTSEVQASEVQASEEQASEVQATGT